MNVKDANEEQISEMHTNLLRVATVFGLAGMGIVVFAMGLYMHYLPGSWGAW